MESRLAHSSDSERSVFTDVSEADISEADISEADISEADISEADVSEADVSEADVSEADVSEADVSEADVSEDGDEVGGTVDMVGFDMIAWRGFEYAIGILGWMRGPPGLT